MEAFFIATFWTKYWTLSNIHYVVQWIRDEAMRDLLATVDIETLGKWAIAAIFAALGALGTLIVKYYWERQSRRRTFKAQVVAHTAITASNVPSLSSGKWTTWDILITNTGQVPITVTSILLVCPGATGGESSFGIWDAFGDKDGKTIAASARAKFPGPRVDVRSEPWKQLFSMPKLTKELCPRLRIGVTGEVHTVVLTPEEVRSLIDLSS